MNARLCHVVTRRSRSVRTIAFSGSVARREPYFENALRRREFGDTETNQPSRTPRRGR